MDDPEFRELLFDLMNALAAKDLGAALECVDAIVALPSREKQKAFLGYVSEGLRNIFLLQQKLSGVTTFGEDDATFYTEMAGRCKRTFVRGALPLLDRSLLLLERNVSQKILFTDLVCKLYKII